MVTTYRDLKIYQESFTLFAAVHSFSLSLPKFEMYEQGSQLRRAADSVNSNIVEGYGRSTYKRDFLRFLVYAQASNDEVTNHLRKIALVHPACREAANALQLRYEQLGKKINKFHQYVKANWRTNQ